MASYSTWRLVQVNFEGGPTKWPPLAFWPALDGCISTEHFFSLTAILLFNRWKNWISEREHALPISLRDYWRRYPVPFLHAIPGHRHSVGTRNVCRCRYLVCRSSASLSSLQLSSIILSSTYFSKKQKINFSYLRVISTNPSSWVALTYIYLAEEVNEVARSEVKVLPHSSFCVLESPGAVSSSLFCLFRPNPGAIQVGFLAAISMTTQRSEKHLASLRATWNSKEISVDASGHLPGYPGQQYFKLPNGAEGVAMCVACQFLRVGQGRMHTSPKLANPSN